MLRHRRKSKIKALKHTEKVCKNQHISKCVSLFYHVFAFHCCSFQISFRSLKKCLISVCSIASDVFLIYIIVVPWTKLSTFSGFPFKKLAAENCIQVCAFAFRIFIHWRGKELLKITRTVEKLGLIVDGERSCKRIKQKTAIILLLHAVYFSALTFECVRSATQIERFGLCKLLNIPTEDPNWTLVVVTVVYIQLVWFVTALPSIFAIYVFFICSLYVDTLSNFVNKTLDKHIKADPKKILLKYDEITKAFFKINETLHVVLLLVCCHILLNSFYSIYISVFGMQNVSNKVPQTVLVLIWSFGTFSFMCVSVSDISDRFGAARNALHRLLLGGKRLENLSLALKLCEDDIMGFVILDTIYINRSLIVKAFGTMLTYGIMMATLGRTSSQVHSHQN